MYATQTANQREEGRILRKQAVEQERKEKIFSPTARRAIEVDAINEQVNQKKQSKEQEKTLQLQQDLERERTLQTLDQIIQQKEMEKREMNKQIAMYNKQQAEEKLKTKRSSPRKEDELSSTDSIGGGVSGLVRFDGEDPMANERRKKQAEQMKTWSLQQAREKEDRKRLEKESDRMYATRMKEIDNRIMEMQENRFRQKSNEEASDRDFNKALAEAKKEREIEQKLAETFNSLAEIKLNTTGNLLTENPDVAYNGNKLVTYAFKGMSPEQIQKIQDEQARQQDQLKLARERERQEKQQWDETILNQSRMLDQKVMEMENRKRDELRRLAEENKRMAEEAKQRNQRLNKELTSNVPTDDFFGQFNKDGR